MPVLYVPILKGKEGEYSALEQLKTPTADLIHPLIEIPPVPHDYTHQRPARTLETHISGVAERLHQCWTDREIYIDIPWLSGNERLANGSLAIARLLVDCAEAGVRAVPVVRVSSSAQHLRAVRDGMDDLGFGFCVRLSADDFDEEAERSVTDEVDRMVQALGTANVRDADLVIDLGDIGHDVSRASLVARSIVAEAPHIEHWRRVIIAAASFPENLSDVSAATTSRLPRFEWQVWHRLQRRRSASRSAFIYGDYAIAHPVPSELDPRTMRMSASIRYTTSDHWLILKGRNVRQYGFDQYFELAKELVTLPEYAGADFCWGDRFIQSVARGVAGPGNATTWRKVGTNHHLTLVARDLAASASHAV